MAAKTHFTALDQQLAQAAAAHLGPWLLAWQQGRRNRALGALTRRVFDARSRLGGSRVFDSVRQTVEYVTPFVGEDTRAGVFVLSDMDDNLGGPEAEEKLVAAFAAIGKRGGSVGLFRQSRCSTWGRTALSTNPPCATFWICWRSASKLSS